MLHWLTRTATDTVAEHVSIGGNGPVLVGTPARVADGLEAWVEEADVDGFNFVSRDILHPTLEDDIGIISVTDTVFRRMPCSLARSKIS